MRSTDRTPQIAMKERRRSSPRSPASDDPAPPARRRPSELVTVKSPFPVEEGVPARPRWWERLRGVAGMGVLVLVVGALAAFAVAIFLVVLAVLIVATLA